MAAPEIIHKLVENFNENRDGYRSGKYNEAQLRLEFLNPFFESLGWDVYNKNGWAPENRDVVIEDSMDIEGSSKKPDYTFKLGRERKFFVEAKKPKVDIQYDIHPAYQLRRYAWNAHMPLSVLTDFEELAIYNCKAKPDVKDSAATAREKFYRYTDYVEKWDEIAGILSKDAVWKGAFDRFADASKGKKGTTAVDDEFLKDMSNWRVLLARNIALRNPQVADEQQLNYAVQMTIDRIIFLRICEDRGIEPEEQLKGMAEKPGIYAALVELFKRADIKYNSGLFHFKKEKGNSTAEDRFTPGLSIDDRVLKEIIKDIYYPCPYIFEEIPVEILGQVYEQFLGKVIRLTAGHRAEVEEKPEVRKAGGVYYTPKYIVDYIVQNTVGKLLKGKTPAEAARLKIVDPACGSGSFLLGAYQHLLDWHLKWYSENEPERWVKGKNAALTQTTVAFTGGFAGYRLTTEKKKEILVNNIHGVDIDAQAVEVTKLSLLLKVLEEESGQLTLGFERVLPDLGKNIQCGNSLIGEDYFAGRLVSDPAERKRVNPFDWQRAFPEVFAQGGFDAVIGNPPYLVLTEENISKEIINYLLRYQVAEYKTDLFHVFIQKGIEILKKRGLLGLITPNTWFTLQFSNKLREYVLKNSTIKELVVFDHKVFQDANVHTGLIFLENKELTEQDTILVKHFSTKFYSDELKLNTGLILQQNKWLNSKGFEFEIRQTGNSGELISRLLGNFPALEVVARASLGCQAYNSSKHTKSQIKNRVFHSDIKLSEEYLPELAGNDVGRYIINRKKGKWIKYGPWLHDYRTMDWLTGPRILIREIPGKFPYRIFASYVEEVFCNYKTILNVNPSIKTNFSIKYLLGILNSKLISYLYPLVSNKLVSETFPRLSVRDIKRLPIRTIDISNPTDVKRHDRMVALVERMLDLHKRTPQTPQEQEQLAREIASTDREIDKLVYELYGLSEEEIRIVESS